MKFAKRMVLVEYPTSRISTRFNNAYSKVDDFLAEPTSNVLYNLDNDMRKVLRRTDLADREKWAQYNQILQRYLKVLSLKRNNAKQSAEKGLKYAPEADERSWNLNDTPPIRTSTTQFFDRNAHNDQAYEFDDNSLPDDDDDDGGLDEQIEREIEEARKPDYKLTIAQPKYLKNPTEQLNPALLNNSNIAVRKRRYTARQSPYSSRKLWAKVKLEK